MRNRSRYMSYLLKLWQAKEGLQLVWRASLEDIQTGEQKGFRDLDSLLDFLKKELSKEKTGKGGKLE